MQRVRLILTMQRDRYLPLKVIAAHLDALERGETSALPNSAGLDEGSPVVGRSRRTRDELVREAGATVNLLQDAVSAGFLPAVESYGDDSLATLTALAQLQKAGIEPRHMRSLRAAAEREVHAQTEVLRKMLLAMARDIRVILIKLTDRLHNMQTLGAMRPDKRRRIARETLEIYAPIAHRLGLNQTYRELQDLAFRYLRPWRYATLSKAVAKARGRRRDLLQKVHKEVESVFAAADMPVRIAGRE